MARKIGFWEAYAIGVGGMIGGGIFAVLGLTILLAKGAAPIAFLFAGLIALLTSYSYAKLSVRYPSQGGTVEFLIQGFGNSLLSGYLNTLLLASYVIMLSLYAYAFGSYASALLFGDEVELAKKVAIIFVLALFTLLNFLGAYLSGKTEDLMVFSKVAILLLFAAIGCMTGDFSKLSPEHYETPLKIATGGLIIFLAYEGFELIANTAQDIENPQKNLPRAYFFALGTTIFIYVLVAAVAVANLTYEEVQKYSDFALALAAKPILGDLGYTLIAIAALLSTASAINATLYGSARVSYLVAKTGALPQHLGKRVWKNGSEGLLILAALSALFAITFNIQNISIAGSLGFLIVFAAVNYANFKLYRQTNSNRWISFAAFILCLVSIVVLVGYNAKHDPQNLRSSLIVLGATLLFEILYRSLTKRKLSPYLDARLKKQERFFDHTHHYLTPIFKELAARYKDLHIYELEQGGNSLKLHFHTNADASQITKQFHDKLDRLLEHPASKRFVTIEVSKEPPKSGKKIM